VRRLLGQGHGDALWGRGLLENSYEGCASVSGCSCRGREADAEAARSKSGRRAVARPGGQLSKGNPTLQAVPCGAASIGGYCTCHRNWAPVTVIGE
jgi:hypothetical protein